MNAEEVRSFVAGLFTAEIVLVVLGSTISWGIGEIAPVIFFAAIVPLTLAIFFIPIGIYKAILMALERYGK